MMSLKVVFFYVISIWLPCLFVAFLFLFSCLDHCHLRLSRGNNSSVRTLLSSSTNNDERNAIDSMQSAINSMKMKKEVGLNGKPTRTHERIDQIGRNQKLNQPTTTQVQSATRIC